MIMSMFDTSIKFVKLININNNNNNRIFDDFFDISKAGFLGNISPRGFHVALPTVLFFWT